MSYCLDLFFLIAHEEIYQW